MTKSKTNALDTLRTLIAERQQYEQWIATLESKRDGTPEHVFNRVHSDYQSRHDRVVNEIRGHAEELELSIATLSARLGEVAKDEEAKRDSIQEAELRAAVGEYDVAQWESMRAEAAQQLEKIVGDKSSLEAQLAELDSIRKLSEVTAPSSPGVTEVSSPPASPASPASQATSSLAPPYASPASSSSGAGASSGQVGKTPETESPPRAPRFSTAGWPARDIIEDTIPEVSSVTSSPVVTESRVAERPGASPSVRETPRTPSASMDAGVATPRPSATPVPATPAPAPPSRKRNTPSGRDQQISSGFSKPVPTPPEGRPEVNKTLKCPECGTANYPTEWYCERCGGELATM
jgi:hypothetical protein